MTFGDLNCLYWNPGSMELTERKYHRLVQESMIDIFDDDDMNETDFSAVIATMIVE
jgi:hypothetical protein